MTKLGNRAIAMAVTVLASDDKPRPENTYSRTEPPGYVRTRPVERTVSRG